MTFLQLVIILTLQMRKVSDGKLLDKDLTDHHSTNNG